MSKKNLSRKKLSIGVLISGSGTNLQALLDASEKKSYPAKVSVVISNKADAFGLKRAEKKNIPTHVIPHEDFTSRQDFEERLIQTLDKFGVELVVLAGFMRVLSSYFIKKYSGRILNIHPALLPAFPGTDAIRKAWDYGVRLTGVTVHFVDEGTDTGPIILQKEVFVHPQESLDVFSKKIHKVEHQLLPKAIRLYAEGKLSIQGRKVLIKEVSPSTSQTSACKGRQKR